MSVNFQFEAGQDFQLEAISSVTDLFEGWVRDRGATQVTDFAEDELWSLGFTSNQWGISDAELVENAHKVQARERQTFTGEWKAVIPAHQKLSLDQAILRDFSVEMETGTGKTYVYLRTAIELYLKYGLSKFVIVVPSVAIREGVVASLNLMKSHFKEIYSGLQFDSILYESKNVTRLRQFASSSHLQFLVMNVQAFNGDKKIINKEVEDLGFQKPIDFITRVQPVVIMDEPQRLDEGPTYRAAIESLNALFRLRYSATHADVHCLVHRLGPVDAYDRRLVKRIEVLSMVAEEDLNTAFVGVKSITASGRSKPTATLVVNRHDGRVSKSVSVNTDLSDLTKLRVYEGWIVEDIVASSDDSPAYVEFANGRRIAIHGNSEVDHSAWQKAQLKSAIVKHLDTELRLARARAYGEIESIKPLTLFFIDKVSNYDPADGPFKLWFEELYDEILKSEAKRYGSLNLPAAREVHKGYFSVTKGRAKDTKGDSADDIEAYNLIMKDKALLLSEESPVRFIFSHSALSEGWDNPNVFTICHLQETASEMRKRQQIGRGLRLPVMANGIRNKNHEYNVLTVVASESFEDFARDLQAEISKETQEDFSGRIQPSRDRRELILRKSFEELPGFQELWAAISKRTYFTITFDSKNLIEEATQRLIDLEKKDPIKTPQIVVQKAQLRMSQEGISPHSLSPQKLLDYERQLVDVPDLLRDLQISLPISRSTIASVIKGSNLLSKAAFNPAQFANQVKIAIRHAMNDVLAFGNGLEYYEMRGSASSYSFEEFKLRTLSGYESSIVDVDKSIYDAIIWDSNVELNYAKDLDELPGVELFLKLPFWFKIDTPFGGYNPDWAIVRKAPDGSRKVFLVRETKGTTETANLRFEPEQWKIKFGAKHFEALEVDYKVAVKASELDKDSPWNGQD